MGFVSVNAEVQDCGKYDKLWFGWRLGSHSAPERLQGWAQHFLKAASPLFPGKMEREHLLPLTAVKARRDDTETQIS